MKIDILTIFPNFFSCLDISLVGKAQARGIVDLKVHDLRSWTHDVHRTVDDTPAGGGAGMVMRPDIWGDAIDAQLDNNQTVLAIPTPAGKPLQQTDLERLAKESHIVVACGRYEGIDERVARYYEHNKSLKVEVFEFSLGDYVLNGGEVAALALVEGVSRLVPQMMGNPDSLLEESHGGLGLLEYPVYTRPGQWRDWQIPEVLQSGNHAEIAKWRRQQQFLRTAKRRPDVLERIKIADIESGDAWILATLGWATKPLNGELSPGAEDNCTQDRAARINSLTAGMPSRTKNRTYKEEQEIVEISYRDFLSRCESASSVIQPAKPAVKDEDRGFEILDPAGQPIASLTFSWQKEVNPHSFKRSKKTTISNLANSETKKVCAVEIINWWVDSVWELGNIWQVILSRLEFLVKEQAAIAEDREFYLRCEILNEPESLNSAVNDFKKQALRVAGFKIGRKNIKKFTSKSTKISEQYFKKLL